MKLRQNEKAKIFEKNRREVKKINKIRQGVEGGIKKGQWGFGGGRYALGKMKLCFRADKKLRSSGSLKGDKVLKGFLLGDG